MRAMRVPLLSAAVACPRAGPAIGTSPLSGYCTHITRYPQLASGIRLMGWCPATGSKPRDAPRLLQQPNEPREEGQKTSVRALPVTCDWRYSAPR